VKTPYTHIYSYGEHGKSCSIERFGEAIVMLYKSKLLRLQMHGVKKSQSYRPTELRWSWRIPHDEIVVLIWAFLITLLVTLPAVVQIDTGGITGTVKDSSGVIMSGATVTLTN
jgi:hypothetical protein